MDPTSPPCCPAHPRQNNSQPKRASVARSRRQSRLFRLGRASMNGFPTTASFPTKFSATVFQREDAQAEAWKAILGFTLYGVRKRERGQIVYQSGWLHPSRRYLHLFRSLPASLVDPSARAQPLAPIGTVINTRPSNLSDDEADDDEERREWPSQSVSRSFTVEGAGPC